jgi:HemY protein
VIAESWMPTSPVTGRLDAFQWRVPVAELTPPRGPLIEQGTTVERNAPVAAPILRSAADQIVDVTPVPAAALPPSQEPKPAVRPNGPIDLTRVRPPDDPGPTAPEPGLDPVPMPGSEFPRGLVKQ